MQTLEKNELYDNEINKPVKSIPECEISFGLVNTTAMEDAKLFNNGINLAPISSEIITVERDYDKQYATLEPDFYLLDGTFVLPKNSKPRDNLGVISYGYTNESEKVEFQIDFDSPFDFKGFQITWNTLLNEYPTSFSVVTKNTDGVEKRTTVSNNTSVITAINEEYENVVQVRIIINSWNVNDRRARFERIEIGSYIIYTSNDLSYVEITNESNPLSLQLPTNQMKFTIIDKNDNFNPDNPEGSYKYLTENSPVSIKWKERIYNNETLQWEEMQVDGGTFYLSGWNSGGDSITYSFTGSDILSLLNKRNYYKGLYYENGIGAKSLINQIVEDAQLPVYAQNKVTVDNELENIIIYSPLPINTHKNCIQLIANYCNAAILMTRDGRIEIKPINNNQNEFLLSGNTIHNKFPRPEINNPVRGVECKIYNYNFSVDLEEVMKQEVELELETGETDEIILTHGAIKDSVLTYDCLTQYITKIEYYTFATIVTIKGFKGKINFVLNGRKSEVTENIYTLNYTDNGYIVNPNGEVVEVDNNIISSLNIAKLVSSNVLNESLNRNIYNLTARGDLRLDPLDMIYIETKNTDRLKVRLLRRQYVYGREDGFIMSCEFRGGNY